MSRFIRFKGLISFVLVMVMITALLYLFAETLIRKGIETGTGWALGAEVNVESVQLNYSPLILNINGFQATDAKQPTHNLFSFDSASAGINVWQYLFGKVIIDELNVDKLTFMTKRSHAGEVYKSIKEQASNVAESALAVPELDLSLPDSKTLLASLEKDNNLQTLKAAEKLQVSYQRESAKLKALQAKLPNKAKLADYKKRVQALGNSKVSSLADIENIKAQFTEIKTEFKADQALILQAKEQLKQSKALLSTQLAQLKAAPAQDWQYIEKKYQLDKVNGEDFAHILFGEQARGYYQKAEMVYQRVLPFLSSNSADDENSVGNENTEKGRFIFFTEQDPLPEILIKKSHISMILPQGDFTFEGHELTHQHWLRNKPSQLTFTSTNVLNSGEFLLNSEFEVAKNSKVSAQGDWSIDNLFVENAQLQKSKSLTLIVDKAKLAGSGKFTFVRDQALDVVANSDNVIDSRNHLKITQASYQGSANSRFGKIALATIKSLDELTVDMNAVGNITQPELSISSSLDKALKNAFAQQVKQKLTGFKKQVNIRLNEKLAAALKMNKQQSNDIVNFEALLTDTDGALEQLKNSDVVKQQKDKLKNKVEDKLKKKLGKLFG